jgi:hypothetical protein
MTRTNPLPLPTTPDAEVSGILCVLIHGTWGRKAAFLHPDSKLQTTFRKEMPGREVVFYNFMWSGRNSIAARSRAARDLQQDLRRLQSQHADRQIFLAAHSHGGNVVFYALRDETLAKGVSGLVFFGVPILVCHTTGFPKIGRGLLLLNLLTLAVMVRPDWWLGRGELQRAIDQINNSGLVVAGIIVASIVLTVALAGWVTDLLEAAQQRVKADLELPDLRGRTFHVIAAGDEAALWLRMLRYLADLPAKCGEWFSMVWWPVFGLAVAWFVLAMFANRLRMVIPLGSGEWVAEEFIGYGAVAFVGLLAVGIAITLAARSLCAALGVSLGTGLGFGWARFWVHLLVSMRVLIPSLRNGEGSLYQIPAADLKGIGSMRHSHTYEHPGALAAAATWISGQAPPK